MHHRIPSSVLPTALALTLLSVAPSASAQQMSAAARHRALEAAVLISVSTPNGNSEGSGAIIDRRGYVLTNLHVVGHLHPFDGGSPGELFREDGLVTLSRTTSSRAEARPTWNGRVVRTSLDSDLALIRIESTIDGAPIAPGTTFPTVSIAEQPVDLSDTVFALGFPLGVRSVTLTSGQVTGFDVDATGALAYLRVDAEFNPGNSGGMLLSSSGRLVGIPTLVSRSRNHIAPIRKARPVERIPAEWLRALATGPITDVQLHATPALGDRELPIRSAGAGTVFGGEELFFLRVPSGFSGDVRFEVDRSLDAPIAAEAVLLSLEQPRAPIRTAVDNVLSVQSTDRGRLFVVLAVRRRREDGTQPGVSRILARLEPTVAVASGTAARVGPASTSGGGELAARPPSLDELDDPRGIGWASFRLEGGLVIDPLVNRDFAGGGQQALGLTLPIYVLDTAWPVTLAFDYGVRAVAGVWRDAAFMMGFATLGARVGIGSPSFMVEVPLYYSIGVGSVEDEFAFSPYGYEIGINARFHRFAVGVSWSESHRGNFSVLRAMSVTTWWYF